MSEVLYFKNRLDGTSDQLDPYHREFPLLPQCGWRTFLSSLTDAAKRCRAYSLLEALQEPQQLEAGARDEKKDRN